MNFIGHHEIAKAYNPQANVDFLFGSVMSDFGRMSGTRRFLHMVNNPDLKEGIRFHNITNRTFDSIPVIEHIEDQLKESFLQFLPKNTAIQASRAGKDLLFDGIFMKNNQALEGIATTIDAALTTKIDLSGINDPSPLLDKLKLISEHGPIRYDLPEIVCNALFKVLSRTRTPIHEDYLLQTTTILERIQPLVFAVGTYAIDQTISALRSPQANLYAANKS